MLPVSPVNRTPGRNEALQPRVHLPATRRHSMNNIIYIVGLVVVVGAVLAFVF